MRLFWGSVLAEAGTGERLKRVAARHKRAMLMGARRCLKGSEGMISMSVQDF